MNARTKKASTCNQLVGKPRRDSRPPRRCSRKASFILNIDGEPFEQLCKQHKLMHEARCHTGVTFTQIDEEPIADSHGFRT